MVKSSLQHYTYHGKPIKLLRPFQNKKKVLDLPTKNDVSQSSLDYDGRFGPAQRCLNGSR